MKEDPRKIPMNDMSMAELWAHIQECKEWDIKEKEAGLEKLDEKDFEL